MSRKEEIEAIICQSIGTTAYHRFSSIPSFPKITDGVKALADVAGCYWLLDVIGSYQCEQELDKAFQVWKLSVNLEASTAVVRGYNDDTLIISQEIFYTDFPLEELKLYLIDGVILLPSEY